MIPSVPSLLPSEVNEETLRSLNKSEVIRVQTALNIFKVRELFDHIAGEVTFVKKDEISGYLGLALQYSTESDKISAGVQKLGSYNLPHFRLNDQINEYGKKFGFIFKMFPKINLSRGRILIAKKDTCLKWHTDKPIVWRLHLPINTNPHAIIEYRNGSFHLPASGDCYLINSIKEHQMVNSGDTDRAHLVFDVTTLSTIKNFLQ